MAALRPLAPRAASLSGPALAGLRGFGIEREVQKLRLKGAVGRAFRRDAPPRLPRRAAEHFVSVLRARGGSGPESRAVARPDALARAERGPAELTSEEKTQLVAHYLPEEREMAKKLRKSCHKWMWRYLSKRRWSRYDACLEQLRAHQLPFDEVTYNLAMFGVLLHPSQSDEGVRRLFLEMSQDGRFHPVLLRLQGGFLDSYFELKEVEAAPNKVNLLKLAKTFWEISVNFKRQRVRDLRRGLAAAALEQRVRRFAEDQLAGHGAQELLEHPTPELAEGTWQDRLEEEEAELSDGRSRAGGVRFPARRPRQMRGVYKGSGVPNRRIHRWRH